MKSYIDQICRLKIAILKLLAKYKRRKTDYIYPYSPKGGRGKSREWQYNILCGLGNVYLD